MCCIDCFSTSLKSIISKGESVVVRKSNGLRRSVAMTACAFFAAVGTVNVAAPAALAHDVVVGGNVEEGKTYDSFPRDITVEFSAVPRDGFNTFAVQNKETGETLFDAEPEINGRELTIETPEDVKPGAGEYQVGYQITSSDGHATRGGITFKVAGESPQESSAEPAPAGQASDGQTPAEQTPSDEGESDSTSQNQSSSVVMWAIVGIGLILGIAAVAVAFIAKRRSSRSLLRETVRRGTDYNVPQDSQSDK